MTWVLLFPIAMLPLLPKVPGLWIGGTGVMLDDLVLAVCVALGAFAAIGRGAVVGRATVAVTGIAAIIACLTVFKAVVLFALGTYMPWVSFDGIGDGVLFQEGMLVLARSVVVVGVFLILLERISTRRQVEIATYLFLLSVAGVIGLGVAQFVLLDHRVLTSSFRPIAFIGSRLDSVEDPWLSQTAAGHEHLAAFCVLSGSVVGGLLFFSWQPKRLPTLALQFLCLGCIFVLVFASSRGGWLGGVGALLCFVAVTFTTGRAWSALRLLLRLVVLLFAVWLFVDVDIVYYVNERVANLLDSTAGNVLDDSAMHRLSTLSLLWRVFLENPLIGLGPGGGGRIAEGQFIRELVEGGVVGATLFMVTIALIWRRAFRCYTRGADSLSRGLGLGLLCGLVGVMVQSLFTELLVVVKVATPFWLVVVLVEKCYGYSLASREMRPAARGMNESVFRTT